MISFHIAALEVALVCITLVAGQGVDQTLVENTPGQDVTEASLRKIQRSGIFVDDQSFLRRLAWVESRFGDSNGTYRTGYDGGIWQLDEVLYINTKNESLSQLHEAIASNFSIVWGNTTWRDCRKPMYSALGARLYLAYLNITIPGTIDLQGDLWVQNYRRDGGNKTKWVEEVEELESEPLCSGSMDICMILDGSGSVGLQNFNLAKSFIADTAVLMRNSSTNSNSTRIALILYSETSQTYFDFANNLTLQEINQTIYSMGYPAGGTNTTGALFTAVQLHEAASPRPGVPKVITTFTDGNNNRDQDLFLEAIDQVRNASLISIAVGIGTEIFQSELRQIALDDPSNVFSVAGFEALTEFVYRLSSETCDLPQEPEVGDNRTDSCNRNEFKYYAYSIPLTGLTIRLEVSVGRLNGYFSYSERTPNSALHDGIITNGWGFVAPRSRQGEGDKVYVSVQGAEDSNEFSISANIGNLVPEITTTPAPITSSSSSGPTTTRAPITSSLSPSSEPTTPSSSGIISKSTVLAFILLVATKLM